MEDNSSELSERVQSLPPELYSQIYDEVFTAPCTVIEINPAYEAPKFLSISRHSRKHFAHSYYGNSLFFFQYDPTPQLLWKWFVALSKSHLALLRQVVFELSYEKYLMSNAESREYEASVTYALLHNLRERGVEISEGVVHVEARLTGEDGEDDEEDLEDEYDVEGETEGKEYAEHKASNGGDPDD